MGYVEGDSEGSGPGSRVRVSVRKVYGEKGLQIEFSSGSDVRARVRLRFMIMVKHW